MNVALGPWVQPDSTMGPLSSHTLLGQLQLEGGTAPLMDSHILQRPKFPQLPGWCGEMREGCQLWAGFRGSRTPSMLCTTPSTQPKALAMQVQTGWERGREEGTDTIG